MVTPAHWPAATRAMARGVARGPHSVEAAKGAWSTRVPPSWTGSARCRRWQRACGRRSMYAARDKASPSRRPCREFTSARQRLLAASILARKSCPKTGAPACVVAPASLPRPLAEWHGRQRSTQLCIHGSTGTDVERPAPSPSLARARHSRDRCRQQHVFQAGARNGSQSRLNEAAQERRRRHRHGRGRFGEVR